MEEHGKSARCGYHVPHLLIGGSACGATMIALGGIVITDDHTDRLASQLRALGLEQVENRRRVFPIHLLSARKASAQSA
jgi:hypothetical protein